MESLSNELLKDENLKLYIAKSYLDEQNRIKQEMISIELEQIIDMDTLEAGKWSLDDNEWMLKDGKSADDVLKLLLEKNIAHIRDLVKCSLLAMENDGLIARQNGKAFESSIILSLPPIAFIKDLLTCDYLSLFDCIFLVGYINDNNAGIISHSIDIAAYAITNAVISPRDPKTYLKFNNSTKRRLTGELIYPDLSWLLTFEEAELWVINSFGVSLKATRDKLTVEPPTHTKTTEVTEITETERNTMLKLIIGMAIDAYGYNPEASKNTATGDNKNGISAKLQTRGINVSDDTIRRILNKAKVIL